MKPLRDKNGRFATKKKAVKAKAKKVAAPKKRKAFDAILSAFVLDTSSSMIGKEAATISGFNEVLQAGQAAAKAGNIPLYERLCTFDIPSREKWSDTVIPLNGFTYRPSGYSTALNDAIGFTINKLEQQLNNSFPKKTTVNVNIFTDGDENSSQKFSNPMVKALIERKQAEGWVISFIGAGTKERVIKAAANIGIFQTNTMNYTNSSAGTQAAFKSVADARSTYVKQASQGLVSTDGFFGN